MTDSELLEALRKRLEEGAIMIRPYMVHGNVTLLHVWTTDKDNRTGFDWTDEGWPV